MLNNVLMRKFSLDKSKIKVLLLEGIHENAEQFFRENGYSDVECLKEALSGNELEKKLQNTHIIGIRSRTELRKDMLLRDFRSKLIRILVATDVMSRGIDVKEINMVINYDVPHDAEDYVHRVGRTARVNAKGEAITLVTQKEIYKLRKIEQLIKSNIPKLQPPGSIGPVPDWVERKIKPYNKRKIYRK